MSTSDHRLSAAAPLLPNEHQYIRSPKRSMRVSASGPQRNSRNPLLNMPIARRLTLGFLIPALIASIALGSISVQSIQLLAKEAAFYNNLVQTYTSLTTASSDLQAMDTRLHETLTEAVQLHLPRETLQENQGYIQHLASYYTTIIGHYRHSALLEQHPDLEALFSGAGDGALLVQQRQLAQSALQAWQDYLGSQTLVLHAITTGDLNGAQAQEYGIGEPYHATAVSALGTLIQFNAGLVNTIHNATQTLENQLLVTMALAILGVILGIGMVGWLVSSTLVRRLKGLRSVVQSIEKGQLDARLDTVGRDEVSAVSAGVNAMLDTIIDAQVLEKLHLELQSQHEALNSAHEHLNQANARLEALATTDALTELPNHRSLVSTLDQELERAQRYQRSCSILFLDIDHFKALNDGYGHASGDTVLHEFAQVIRTRLRGIDTAGRWGGEEFVAILPEMTKDEAQTFAEEMRLDVAASLFSVGGGMRLTCSIGVACYPSHATGREDLMNAADQAMYGAKRLGRNQVRRVDDPLVQAILLEENEEGGREELALAGIVTALSKLVEAHDPSVGQHSLEVSELLPALMQILGLPASEAQMIALAGRLHDIGKISIPGAILSKPGRLTDEEWALIRTHAATGAEVVSNVPILRPLAAVIRSHHERWDGQGYPDLLAGKAIPFGARILAVVNAYTAMTVDRSYQKARSHALALEELKRCAGTQFDPQVVEAMERLLVGQQLAELAEIV